MMQAVEISSTHGASTPGSGARRDSFAQEERGLIRSLRLSLQLRRFAARHFAQLNSEFEALCAPEYRRSLDDVLSVLRRCNQESPSWELNHRLEFLLINGLPEPLLRQRAVIHRDRLLALVGPEGTETFSTAFPPLDSNSSLELIRTHTLGTLMEIQRVRNVRSEFERLRNRLIAASLAPGLVYFALATAYAHIFPTLPLAAIAAIFGSLGGYLSSLLRVSSLHWSLSSAANYQQVDRLFWNIFLNFYLCIIEGALAAIVLYVLFSAAILPGSLFPVIPDLPGNPLPRASMVSHQNETRLMLWALVAGVSERLVPDFLTGLGAEVSRTKAKPA